MKDQVGDTARPAFVKGASFLDRQKTSILRTCVLNLIAQIALGTPVAGQATFTPHPVGSASHDCSIALKAYPDFGSKQTRRHAPCSSEGHQKLKTDDPAQSRLNVIATETETNKKQK